MANTNYTLNKSTWTAITTAGQSGRVFLQTGGACAIDHSTTGGSDCTVAKAYKLYLGNNGSNVLPITKDGTSDIFYAIALSTSNPDTVVLTADVI